MDGAAGPGVDRPADLELVRVAILPKGAFGILLADQRPFAVTLERTESLPDAPAVQILKIPAGRFLCRRTWFRGGAYETFEVIVPGHARLLFHRGNSEEDSEGCILIGRRFDPDGPRILESVLGFSDFMRWADHVLTERVAVMRSSFELLVRAA